jgi:hypothetical protein
MGELRRIPEAELTPHQHVKIAEELINTADAQDDPTCASANADVAMAHLMAAGVKLCLNLLGGKRSAGGAAILSMVTKLAR